MSKSSALRKKSQLLRTLLKKSNFC